MKQSKSLTLLQLYPDDMNIYGDSGNALVLARRIEWHGYNVNLIAYNPGDAFPNDVDLVIGGGGQDSGQLKIHEDLLEIAPKLHALADDNVPMLMICGLYQLFGHRFKTRLGDEIKGIGLLDLETIGGDERLTGNIVTSSDEFGLLVGYENHSGLTTLGSRARPLGTVIKGAGNNNLDQTEGARYKNVIGTYLHGPILPKNPLLADWLIEQAAIHKYGDFEPNVIEDRFAEQARDVAQRRPR